MAAGVWTLYNSVPHRIGTGELDFDNDSFKIAFLTSSYTPSAAHDTYSDLTNELTTASGYTSGGVTTTMSTIGDTGGLETAAVSATGNITFRYMVLYDTTTTYLVGYALADNTPADYTISSGNDWKFTDSIMFTHDAAQTNDWKSYDDNQDIWWVGTYNLSSDELKMALFTTSYIPDFVGTGDTTYAGISANELASGDGYTTGGVVLSKTWSDIGSGVAELDLTASATWTFTADKLYRYAVIYRTTSGTLLCVADLTGSGNDTCNNTLTISAGANGILRASL